MTTPELLDAAQEIVRVWEQRPGRAVIFDFNGTLSDDEPILERVFGELFAEHLGWTMTAADYRDTLLGHSDREIAEIGVREHGDGDPEVIERIMQERSERYKTIVAEQSPITSAAIALVEQLAAAGVPMAIVTGAQRADVEAVLASSPVGRHIRVVVADEDVEQGKPDPSGFRRGAELLGVPAEDVLVFEDSVPGITGAGAAGMACIAVTGPEPIDAVLAIAPGAIAVLGPDVLVTTSSR